MEGKQILEDKDKLYEHLMAAYELAGGLRDSFSGVDHSGELKEFCNTIRGKIYDLRELKGPFTQTIKSAYHV